MDFADQIRMLASRIPTQLEHLSTEAATTTTLVFPFVQALGYNVFDPTEVIPEYSADVGTKKGEKVDIAIKNGEDLSILVEVKHWNVDLDAKHLSQLYRYFSVTKAKVGVLTNGRVYQFYTDLDDPNKLDETPFLRVDMENLKDNLIEELKKFSKSNFNRDKIEDTASNLKYTTGIKKIVADELVSPSEEFVKFFARQVYSGRRMSHVLDRFTSITKRALNQFINDRINERLQSAIAAEPREDEDDEDEKLPDNVVRIDGDIITTQEEVDGYQVVKAIVAKVANVERVAMRDTKSYCGILLDDNNRRPICRLYFHHKKKQVGVFDEHKNETKHQIETVEDLYNFADEMRGVIGVYDKKKSSRSKRVPAVTDSPSDPPTA